MKRFIVKLGFPVIVSFCYDSVFQKSWNSDFASCWLQKLCVREQLTTMRPFGKTPSRWAILEILRKKIAVLTPFG